MKEKTETTTEKRLNVPRTKKIHHLCSTLDIHPTPKARAIESFQLPEGHIIIVCDRRDAVERRDVVQPRDFMRK